MCSWLYQSILTKVMHYILQQLAEDAAAYGRVEVLRYLHANGREAFPDHLAGLAATHGHLEALEFALSCGQHLNRRSVNFRVGKYRNCSHLQVGVHRLVALS